jgi:hypothetical protein
MYLKASTFLFNVIERDSTEAGAVIATLLPQAAAHRRSGRKKSIKIEMEYMAAR